MKNKVIFRADGNAEIGMGHITRSLAMAEIINEHFNCFLATRFITESIKEEALKICKGILDLDFENHEKQLLELLKGNEIVVLDNYFYQKSFREKLKSTGAKIICIDDLGGDFTFCDMIINHSPDAFNLNYQCDPDAKLLLGLEYALLRSPFLDIASQPILPTNLRYDNVFICFGGSDHKNLTLRTIENLSKLKEFKRINIVVGNAYEHLESLEIYLSKTENIRLYVGICAKQMKELMEQSDFGIVPSSGILIEALSVKLPVITGYYAQNQKNISNYFTDKGIGHVIGNFNTNSITKNHLTFNQNMKSNMSKLIDGQSGRRILQVFQNV